MIRLVIVLLTFGVLYYMVSPLLAGYTKAMLQFVLVAYLLCKVFNKEVFGYNLFKGSTTEKGCSEMEFNEIDNEVNELSDIASNIEVVRCPLCDSPIDVVSDAELDKVRCGECSHVLSEHTNDRVSGVRSN